MNTDTEEFQGMFESLSTEEKLQLALEIQKQFHSPRLDAYQAVREPTIAFNTKLFALMTKEDTGRYSLLLGLRDPDDAPETLIFDSENEFTYFGDFAIHDYRNTAGKTAVQRYREQAESLTEFEEQALNVKQAAKTGLFAVLATDRVECTVTLRNLLNKTEAPVTITDRGLSLTLKPNYHLIFTRIMHYPEFNSSSGMAMIFTQRKYDKLHKAFEKRYKKLPANLSPAEKRFIAFFHLNREFGELLKMQ
jgi:hypothetical protein